MWDISVYADEIFAPEAGIEPGLALLARSGIARTDLRVVNGCDSFMMLKDGELAALGKLLADHGVRVGALETPIFKCPLRKDNAVNWGNCPGFADDLSFEDHLKLLPRAFEIADRLGTREIRCFSFWRQYDLDEVFGEVVEKLGFAANLASAAGHRLCLENEQDTLAGTGVELARILKAVGSPCLRASFDVGNSARLGGVPYPDDYRELRGLLDHVLVKFQAIDVRCGWGHPDADQSGPKSSLFAYYFWCQADLPVGGWVQIGERRFDIEGLRTFIRLEETIGVDCRSLFKALRSDGYDGFITVDTNYFIPGAGATGAREIEANFERTISSLRKLIAEVWS